MSAESKHLGNCGEDAAIKFLTSNGYTIIETNYRTPRAEIDIIAEQDKTLCFIEVKTRKSLTRGLPGESVTHLKQKKIIIGAQHYIKEKRFFDTRIRFDVIEVFKCGRSFEFNLIRHAFQTG